VTPTNIMTMFKVWDPLNVVVAEIDKEGRLNLKKA
jgi:hypothetical protein